MNKQEKRKIITSIIFGILGLIFLGFLASSVWFNVLWIFPVLIFILLMVYLLISLFESDIDKHYYITFFGKNMGVVRAGSGLHVIPLLLFNIDPIVTETIEDSFPAREEVIDFSSDDEKVGIPNGKVKTYRITTNGKNVGFTDPEDVNNFSIRAEIIELHKELNSQIKNYKPSENDVLEKRITLEPRFLVKYKIISDCEDDEELADAAEQFFKKFSSMADLRNAIGVTTYDILANIFGKVTPGTLVTFQELISKLVHLRLKGIYDDKGVQIIHFGLANPGIPHELSSKMSDAAEAIAIKDKKIIEAQADRESTLLKEMARLEIKEKENKVEIDRKQKEAEVAGTAKLLLYEAEAKGVAELAKSLGLNNSENIIIKQLETLRDALKDNNFNIIMNTNGSNSGGLQDLLDLAKIKLIETKKE